jgi:hypothetical protein
VNINEAIMPLPTTLIFGIGPSVAMALLKSVLQDHPLIGEIAWAVFQSPFWSIDYAIHPLAPLNTFHTILAFYMAMDFRILWNVTMYRKDYASSPQ